MREIKFRAWNKKIKKMGSAFPLRIIMDDIAERPGAYHEDIDNLIIMQFTGLHDKNGKEIYEGDIIQFEYDDDPIGPGVVTFGIQSIGEDDWQIKHITPCFAVKWGDSEDCSSMDDGKNIKIIGNIYENKELLQK